jgi:hypothetical protein
MVEPVAANETEAQLIDDLAAKLRDWGLAAPGIAFLEANKPFSFLGSQLLTFFQPLLSTFIQPAVTDGYISLLQNRTNVEELIRKLESSGDAHPR